MKFKAATYKYNIICNSNRRDKVYPFLCSICGDTEIDCVSPNHGRSFVVGHNKGRYVISKGNGLSYSQYDFLHTGEFGDYSWGLLIKDDAIRDFKMGEEVSSLGIKTNRMEYVLELEENIALPNGHNVRPILLQYSVECPYRICDIAFMRNQQVIEEISKWRKFNDKNYDEPYLIAANVLVKNLKILHDNNILHNAIHSQNYTWALELLDFEIACSPKHPFEDNVSNLVKDLFTREILYTYEVINYIAWCLGDKIDYKQIDNIFKDYGFSLDTLNARHT